MARCNKEACSVLGTICNILTIPCNFISGLVVGLAAPVAVIAAIRALLKLGLEK